MPVRSVLKNVCGADRQSVTASLTFQVFNPIIISLFLSLSLSLSLLSLPLSPSLSSQTLCHSFILHSLDPSLPYLATTEDRVALALANLAHAF